MFYIRNMKVYSGTMMTKTMSLNPVINAEQAHQITRGRTPLIPVEYETAVKSLAACVTLNEAKYWDNKADALAAWAKIYHSREAELKSKQLKLHAYRRMGALAAELRPARPRGRPSNASQQEEHITPERLLKSHGLSSTEARAARRLSTLPERKFTSLLAQPKAPTTVANDLCTKYPLWREFSRSAMGFRAFTRRVTPAQFATLCKQGDSYSKTMRELLLELSEWTDEVLERLPVDSRSSK